MSDQQEPTPESEPAPTSAAPESKPPEADPIDDPRGSRADLVVPVLVFLLLVVGIGRTVHQGSQPRTPPQLATPAPVPSSSTPAISDAADVIAEIRSELPTTSPDLEALRSAVRETLLAEAKRTRFSLTSISVEAAASEAPPGLAVTVHSYRGSTFTDCWDFVEAIEASKAVRFRVEAMSFVGHDGPPEHDEHWNEIWPLRIKLQLTALRDPPAQDENLERLVQGLEGIRASRVLLSLDEVRRYDRVWFESLNWSREHGLRANAFCESDNLRAISRLQDHFKTDLGWHYRLVERDRSIHIRNLTDPGMSWRRSRLDFDVQFEPRPGTEPPSLARGGTFREVSFSPVGYDPDTPSDVGLITQIFEAAHERSWSDVLENTAALRKHYSGVDRSTRLGLIEAHAREAVGDSAAARRLLEQVLGNDERNLEALGLLARNLASGEDPKDRARASDLLVQAAKAGRLMLRELLTDPVLIALRRATPGLIARVVGAYLSPSEASRYSQNPFRNPMRWEFSSEPEILYSAADSDSGGGAAPVEVKVVPVHPEPRSWLRSPLTPHTSRLRTRRGDALPLLGLHAGVRVDGFRARVELNFYFSYPRDLPASDEARFDLRLPDGAVPHTLAFGPTTIRGAKLAREVEAKAVLAGELPAKFSELASQAYTQPKPARMVTRELARRAYENTVRRQIDPALLEWQGAGIFQVRVYPLQRDRLHRIRLAYDLDLVREGKDLLLNLDLPQAKRRRVDVSVAGGAAGISVRPSLKLHEAGGRTRFRLDDAEERGVQVRLRNAARATLLTGVDSAAGPCAAVSLRPAMPPSLPAGNSHAVFLLDTSLSSRRHQTFPTWLELLEQILTQNSEIESFALLSFNVEQRWWREGFVPSTPENVSAALEHARSLSLEGATDVQAALTEALKVAAGADADTSLFLLSDGDATWGRDPRAATSDLGSSVLYAYRLGLERLDAKAVTELCRRSGGAEFTLAGDADLQSLARAHRQRHWRLERVEIPGMTDLVIAGRPTHLYAGQRLVVAGRGKPQGTARLHLRGGAERHVVEQELPPAISSPLAARVYGQIATDQLERTHLADVELAIAYARHFKVPGRTCSLLMLESEADYERWGIRDEADAKAVAARPAGEALAQAHERIKSRRRIPRAAFMRVLHRLERSDNVRIRWPRGFLHALRTLPGAAYEVDSPSLHGKQTSQGEVPESVRLALRGGQAKLATLLPEARRRLAAQGPPDALRLLSSALEDNPGDPGLAHNVGASATSWGLGEHAYHLLRRAIEAHPEEPHLYAALARSLEDLSKGDLAFACYEVALAGDWLGRDLRVVYAQEALRLLGRIEAGQLKTHLPEYLARRRKELAEAFPLDLDDLVVVATWSGKTDVDLSVIEPSGEACTPLRPISQHGGRLSRDVIDGYGPEIYTLPKAPPGTYRILARCDRGERGEREPATGVTVTVHRRAGERSLLSRHTISLLDGDVHEVVAIEVE